MTDKKTTHLEYVFSSDPLAGAFNLNAGLNEFSVGFDAADPFGIPDHATNVRISIPATSIWNTVSNITSENNRFYVTDGVTPYNVTIPQGLYDVVSLNNTLQTELTNLGAPTTPPLFTLTGESSTNKVLITFNYTTTSIDFTPPDTPRDILGFNPQVVGPVGVAPTVIRADNVAAFNVISSFIVKSDLGIRGLRLNNTYDNFLINSLIVAKPGSLSNYEPRNPSVLSANELIGVKRTELRFTLVDQNNQAVDTNGEYYSFRMVVEYDI